GYARPGKFDRCIQRFIVVVLSAQRDDHIFATNPLRESAFQHNLDRSWNLPPELARGPDGGSVGPYDGSADRAQRAVHVGVGVGSNDERSGKDVAALYHDLVPDTRSCGIEVDLVLAGKRFD